MGSAHNSLASGAATAHRRDTDGRAPGQAAAHRAPPGPGRPVGVKKRKRGRPPAVPEPPRAEVVARTRPFSWAQAVDPDPDPAGDVEAKRRRAADSAEEQPAAAPQPASTGPKRVNYSKGEALAKLTRAVHDWDNKSG